jgi:hypothetical protein
MRHQTLDMSALAAGLAAANALEARETADAVRYRGHAKEQLRLRLLGEGSDSTDIDDGHTLRGRADAQDEHKGHDGDGPTPPPPPRPPPPPMKAEAPVFPPGTVPPGAKAYLRCELYAARLLLHLMRRDAKMHGGVVAPDMEPGAGACATVASAASSAVGGHARVHAVDDGDDVDDDDEEEGGEDDVDEAEYEGSGGGYGKGGLMPPYVLALCDQLAALRCPPTTTTTATTAANISTDGSHRRSSLVTGSASVSTASPRRAATERPRRPRGSAPTLSSVSAASLTSTMSVAPAPAAARDAAAATAERRLHAALRPIVLRDHAALVAAWLAVEGSSGHGHSPARGATEGWDEVEDDDESVREDDLVRVDKSRAAAPVAACKQSHRRSPFEPPPTLNSGAGAGAGAGRVGPFSPARRTVSPSPTRHLSPDHSHASEASLLRLLSDPDAPWPQGGTEDAGDGWGASDKNDDDGDTGASASAQCAQRRLVDLGGPRQRALERRVRALVARRVGDVQRWHRWLRRLCVWRNWS